jgi:hypothetical protein
MPPVGGILAAARGNPGIAGSLALHRGVDIWFEALGEPEGRIRDLGTLPGELTAKVARRPGEGRRRHGAARVV